MENESFVFSISNLLIPNLTYVCVKSVSLYVNVFIIPMQILQFCANESQILESQIDNEMNQMVIYEDEELLFAKTYSTYVSC